MIKEGVVLGKRYEILGRIGSGGMADVYKGKDHKLNRYVAIKVLKSDYRTDEVLSLIHILQVIHIPGNLTDHYNPGKKTLGLSDTVYNSTSVAAIGVAAHECGHAVQHATGYVPLAIRGALVPVANIGSMAAWPLILIGLFMNGRTAIFLINLGILLFSAAVLFQLVTLPVEFNASGRAVKVLETSGMLYPDEVGSVKKVLSAAALTYVASAAAMILQLLRLIIIGGRRRND